MKHILCKLGFHKVIKKSETWLKEHPEFIGGSLTPWDCSRCGFESYRFLYPAKPESPALMPDNQNLVKKDNLVFKSHPFPLYDLESLAYDIKKIASYIEVYELEDGEFMICVFNEKDERIVLEKGNLLDIIKLTRNKIKKLGFHL